MGAPVTVLEEVRRVYEGDWVEGKGIVQLVWPHKRTKQVILMFNNDTAIYQPNDQVLVRIEDHGEEDDNE